MLVHVNGYDRLLFFLLPTVDMCHLTCMSLRDSVIFVCSKRLNITAHEVEGQHMKRQKQSGKQAAMNVFWNRGFRSRGVYV